MANVIKARQQLHAKYWLRTHDEVKIAHGLVAVFSKERSIHWHLHLAAIRHRRQEANATEESFIDYKNGQNCVLIWLKPASNILAGKAIASV